MDVYIFILCYNEEILLPHTIEHYRTYIPNCHIIIYDNYSTDNSVAIAEQLGCLVISFKSDGMDDTIQSQIKNTCWRNIKNGWIICIDMDEWLCITDDELLDEYLCGTTVITIKGINIIGDSNTTTLNDINLHTISNGEYYPHESKKLCFLVPDITFVKYDGGAHNAKFKGRIQYSKYEYINKHMDFLGLPFYLNKKKDRNSRLNAKNTNYRHLNTWHYSSDDKLNTNRYLKCLSNSEQFYQNKMIVDMDVYIFILCYNEEVLLPHTIKHYRAYIPDCHIIIYDNYSTDNSAAIAKELGCLVVQWKSNGIDDNKYIQIKNTCWKNVEKGWVLCIDMDEWLCITYDELLNEYIHGTTVISIKGINIIGNSNTTTLNDINLHALKKTTDCPTENKKLCFLVPEIKSVVYLLGAHTAIFTGDIKYSTHTYINKHMEFLGLQFYLEKKRCRHSRLLANNPLHKNFKHGNKHYSSNMKIQRKKYLKEVKKSKYLKNDSDIKLLKLFIYHFLHNL